MLKGKGLLSGYQKDILKYLASLPDSRNFYLTGGTALAEFYFGHRLSYDLDLFTSEQKLILPFSRMVETESEKRREKTGLVKAIRRFETFVEFEFVKPEETVKVQFAFDSPFRFQDPEETEFEIRVNDYNDITVDKFLAFFGRAEARDAIDLYFILKNRNLNELIQYASQKDPGFDPYWLAVAFEKIADFPDEIERWPVTMLSSIDLRDLKQICSHGCRGFDIHCFEYH